ncbi:TPA: hypothetical protein ACH3X1_013994 [Trebouxia sp. C0004]
MTVAWHPGQALARSVQGRLPNVYGSTSSAIWILSAKSLKETIAIIKCALAAKHASRVARDIKLKQRGAHYGAHRESEKAEGGWQGARNGWAHHISTNR